jgi:hypothetical protein
MTGPIRYSDNASFLRHWAERAYDDSQLGLIAAMQQVLIDFAMNAWRPTDQIQPPVGVPLICVSGDVVLIMSQNENHEWRTTIGSLPHKPPRAWMPCPVPPAP